MFKLYELSLTKLISPLPPATWRYNDLIVFYLSSSEDHNFLGNDFLTWGRVSVDTERIELSTDITFYHKIRMVWILEKLAFSIIFMINL